MRYGYNKFLMEKLAKLTFLLGLLLCSINCTIIEKPPTRDNRAAINQETNRVPLGPIVKDIPQGSSNEIDQTHRPLPDCYGYSYW